MKAYQFKAIAYPAVGVLHIVFLKHLPNLYLGAAIIAVCFLIGGMNLERWR
jgi:hypothetical protein